MVRKISSLLFVLAVIYWIWTYTHLGENFYQWQYDKVTGQQLVTTREEISKVLSSFTPLPFSQVKKEYLAKTKYDTKKYFKLAKDANFLIVNGKDIFKFVVGDFRVKNFLPRDDYYYENIDALGEGKEVLWLVDKKLLFKLLELQNLLFEKGYNETGFTIINGFRHPAYNEKVGGASLSRHLQGQALDIQIGDINDDGFSNQKDKSIVLDLLEKEIIKDQGGIGRYPGSMSVHFDVRGYRARWDSH